MCSDAAALARVIEVLVKPPPPTRAAQLGDGHNALEDCASPSSSSSSCDSSRDLYDAALDLCMVLATSAQGRKVSFS